MSKKYLRLFPEQVLALEQMDSDENTVYLKARKKNCILEVSLYRRDENPELRIFFEGNKCATYMKAEEKFSQKSIYDLRYGFSIRTAKCEVSSDKMVRRYFKSFLISDTEEIPLLDLIEKCQRIIKQRNLAKKYENEARAIDEKMKLFRKPIPRGYKNFVRNKVFEKDFVLFYCRKEDSAFCTKCGTWHKYSELDQRPQRGKTIVCPTCRTTVRCRTQAPENGIVECAWSLLVQTDDENRVLFRYFCHRLSIEENKEAEITTVEMQRAVTSENGTETFIWEEFHNTGMIRWCKYHDPCGFFTPSRWRYPTIGIHVYPRGNEKVSMIGRYKYSSFEHFCKAGYFENSYTPERYLAQYQKKPYFEKLVKVGFTNLVVFLMNAWSGEAFERGLNTKASGVKELLDIDSQTYKRLLKIGNPTYEQFYLIKRMAFFSDVEISLIKDMPIRGSRVDAVKRIFLSKEMTVHKFVRYVKDNCPENLDIYLDYLEMRRFLDYPMTDAYLFPKNLRRKHDMFMQEKAQIMEKKRKEELEVKSKKLTMLAANMNEDPRFHMEDDLYTIILPDTYAALQNESKILNHCVKNYIDRIADGRTMIFFIRKKEELDKPFFTLEIDKELELVQCRTRNNKKAEIFDKEKGTHVHLFAQNFQRQLVQAAMVS